MCMVSKLMCVLLKKLGERSCHFKNKIVHIPVLFIIRNLSLSFRSILRGNGGGKLTCMCVFKGRGGIGGDGFYFTNRLVGGERGDIYCSFFFLLFLYIMRRCPCCCFLFSITPHTHKHLLVRSFPFSFLFLFPFLSLSLLLLLLLLTYLFTSIMV